MNLRALFLDVFHVYVCHGLSNTSNIRLETEADKLGISKHVYQRWDFEQDYHKDYDGWQNMK